MRLLVVEDDKAYHAMMREAITESFGAKWQVLSAHCGEEALEHIESGTVHAFVLDMALPWGKGQKRSDVKTGQRIIEEIEKRQSEPLILVLSSQDKRFAVKLLLGFRVVDYVFKDTPWKEIQARVGNLLRRAELEQENRILRSQLGLGPAVEPMGESEPFLEALSRAKQVAREETTVLLLGESGTGKEVLAQAIHRYSERAEGPFVAVNCAALSENLLESELFGHCKGAFTGATSERQGRFELAQGGTLFLDEVGELPPTVQVKLLRVLQEKTYERIGENTSRCADVRLVSATNRRLEEAVDSGLFRQDLYYRLNVFPIYLPPLRVRGGDVLLLAEHFLKSLPKKRGRTPSGFSEEAQKMLLDYGWPGNIRELRNAVEHAMIVEMEDIVGPSSLPFSPKRRIVDSTSDFLKERHYKTAMDIFEKAYLTALLDRLGGKVKEAAAETGLALRTFRDRLARHGLKGRSFK